MSTPEDWSTGEAGRDERAKATAQELVERRAAHSAPATPRRLSARPPIPACRRRRASTIPALDKDSCGVGFIADIKGRKSHQIVEDALTHPAQSRASRRGRRRPARGRRRRHPGADPAQVLRQGSQASSASRCPRPANTPSAICSCRATRTGAQIIREIYAEVIAREGLTLLGWRDVPTDNSTLGESVKPTEPVHMQVFIGRGKKKLDRGRFRAPALHPAQGDLERDLPAPRAPHCPAITRCRSPAAR